jgi:hypothetical protein
LVPDALWKLCFLTFIIIPLTPDGALSAERAYNPGITGKIMSIARRIDEARKAFERRDLVASEAAHTPEIIAEAVEEHGGASHQYIGDMVYGGLNGIVTTFAVVSGLAGASLGASIILILGLANFLADDLSMSFWAVPS